MTNPSYPVGIAIKNAGGRKTKENRHLRSMRQRRKAYDKELDRLFAEVEKKWASPDDIPAAEMAVLMTKIERAQKHYLGLKKLTVSLGD